MRRWVLVTAVAAVCSAMACARQANGELGQQGTQSQQETRNSKATKQSPPPSVAAPTGHSREVPATFPAYTPEIEKEIKSLRAGPWIPVTIDRAYLILRYSGIRLEPGDYFVQLLSDQTGNVTKFLVAKKRDIKLEDVNLAKATAKDGSFAEVLNFNGRAQNSENYKETRAFVVSSGESGAVWVHVSGSEFQWQGEPMGLANRSKKLTVTQ